MEDVIYHFQLSGITFFKKTLPTFLKKNDPDV